MLAFRNGLLIFALCFTGTIEAQSTAFQSSKPVASTTKARTSQPAKPVHLGWRRELFVDDFLIESLNGARLLLHRPQAANVAIKFDKPWEGAFSGYVTVLKTPDRYLLYYRGLPQAGKDGTNSEVTCVAQSEDGIRWKKQNVGKYEVHGSKENNIVLMNQAPASHNFAPFLDSNPKARTEHRFKALGGNDRGLIAFVSADGLSWKRLQEKPVFKQGVFDSQNVSFWSASEQKYVCYFRTWTKGGYRGFRTISRTTSTDFVNWTKPVAMKYEGKYEEHLYTNQTSPYYRAPHVYIGLAARFMPGRKVLSAEDAKRVGVNRRYSGDCSDTVLISTRGGANYDRTFRESFLRPGLGQENWVSRSNYAACGIVPTGSNEVSVYLARNYGQASSYLQRYKLRVDGFASINSGFGGGTMTTRLLTFAIPRSKQPVKTVEPSRVVLSLNVSTSAAGSVKAEFLDETGKAIEGFSKADCDVIIGDKTDYVVRWKGNANVKRLMGASVRLKFYLKDADLYSLQFKPK